MPPPSHDQDDKENTVTSRLKEYEKGVRKINELTGISDANEIIQKFATHGETFKSLEHLKNKNERKILDLQDKKLQAQNELEKARFEGVDAVSIKKQAEEIERNLNIAL